MAVSVYARHVADISDMPDMSEDSMTCLDRGTAPRRHLSRHLGMSDMPYVVICRNVCRAQFFFTSSRNCAALGINRHSFALQNTPLHVPCPVPVHTEAATGRSRPRPDAGFRAASGFAVARVRCRSACRLRLAGHVPISALYPGGSTYPPALTTHKTEANALVDSCFALQLALQPAGDLPRPKRPGS